MSGTALMESPPHALITTPHSESLPPRQAIRTLARAIQDHLNSWPSFGEEFSNYLQTHHQWQNPDVLKNALVQLGRHAHELETDLTDQRPDASAKGYAPLAISLGNERAPNGAYKPLLDAHATLDSDQTPGPSKYFGPFVDKLIELSAAIARRGPELER